MTIPVQVFPDAATIGRVLAAEIADGIEKARTEGVPYLLGCPGGRTPRPTYAALAAEVARRRLPLGHLVIAMMDDYVVPGPSGGFAHVPADAHFSCRRFGREEIAGPLSAAAPEPVGGLWLPDPAAPEQYDERLRDAGGIDLFILASGGSDGHVAFNPPGTPREAATRIVRLAETTKRDNLGTFPAFASSAEVPDHGVTVGPATIAGLSRRLVLLLDGEHKRQAYQRIATAGTYDPGWPATIVTEGRNPQIYADRTATT
ncbi:6-phosphogluconolactonase [Streptosporangium soli]|nr:6-phosphogluconolactonase [Streptosporangium sp. KLBMP 9127]